MILVSKYVYNDKASKKQTIFSFLIDYFSIFILTYFVFIFSQIAVVNMPVYKENETAFNTAMDNIYDYIVSSGVYSYNSDGEINPIDVDATKFVTNLAKTNAFMYNLPYPIINSENTYDTTHMVNIEETFLGTSLNNLEYYVNTFKASEEGLTSYLYDGVDYSSDKQIYLYEKILTFNSSNNNMLADSSSSAYISYSSSISKYLILKEEVAQSLISKVAYDDSSNNSCYDLYISKYKSGIDYFINDIETNSIKYKDLNDSFMDVYLDLTNVIIVDYVVCYTIVFLLYYLINILINKEYKTLGMRTMRLGVCSKNDNSLSTIQTVGAILVSFVLMFSSILLGLFFNGMLGVVLISKFYVILLGFILTLNIIDLFYSLFNKKNENIIALITNISYRDTNVDLRNVEANNGTK